MDNRCLVICSGGMDSTTAATHALMVDARQPILLHFQYGCRAEAREEEAVRNVAAALGVEHLVVDFSWLKHLGGSSLTDSRAAIAGPIEGAEYPDEWGPARNLLRIAQAPSVCE